MYKIAQYLHITCTILQLNSSLVYLQYLCVFSHSVLSDSVTPRTVAHQAPLSIEFSRQEYWSWLPLPTLGDLPDPGIEPVSLASPAFAAGFFTTALYVPCR